MTCFEPPEFPGQFNLATAAQLKKAGATDWDLRLMAARGQRLLRNVYTCSPGESSPDIELMAGLLWAGKGAVLTGLHGLKRYGVQIDRTPLLARFLVPDTRPVRSSAPTFVTLRTRRLPAPVVRAGIPVAPMERCLVDAARYKELGLRDQRACGLQVLQRRLTTPRRLATELALGGILNARGIGEAVVAYRQGAWSEPEHTLADAVLADERLPQMLSNPLLVSTGGGRVGRPDGYFPDAGVVVQVHSRLHHEGFDQEGRDQEADTIVGDLTYHRHGLVVVPVTPRVLHDDVQGVLDTLAAVVLPRLGHANAGVTVADERPHP